MIQRLTNNNIAFISLFQILLVCIAYTQTNGSDSTRPNILLIVSEDHGQHLSSYGDTVIQTPHLDSIADEGMLFKNAYVTQSVCSPSRSSILTGLYPHQNGHLGLATQGYHFVGDINNIYGLLKKGGYRTGMIGKLHLNPESSFPIDYHPIKGSNFAKKGLDRYAAYADTMMNASNDPFFLMVNFPDAHYPFQDRVEGLPSDPIASDDIKPFTYIGFYNRRIRNITTSYYNCILRLDESVGMLMNKLKETDKEENTLVIYLSDHGDEMARGKFDIYEASTKIPFVVSWSGKADEGTKSEALISTIDIVPTILDAAGLSTSELLPGKSLIPLLKNSELNFREYLFTEYNADPILYFPRRAVRDDKYKLIYTLLTDRKNPTAVYYTENRTPALEGSPTLEELKTAPDSVQQAYNLWLEPPEVQLFDLEDDPWEFHNLASDSNYSDVKKRLLEALFQWQKETRDPLRFPKKLQQLTQEHDKIDKWGFKDDWQYPRYLYSND